MIDKKMMLMGGVFGGIGIYCIPIFMKSVPSLPFKIVGGLVMAAPTIFFIAGDVLLGKSSGGSGYGRDIRSKLKKGLITEQQAFEMEKLKLEQQIVMEKKKVILAKQRAEITKLKNQGKKQMDMGALLGGDSKSKKEYKLPGVLGNLGPVIGEKKKPTKDHDDLRDLF